MAGWLASTVRVQRPPAPPTWSAPAEAVSFVVNRIIDAVFLMDVIISFFMPFRTSQVEGGTWVHDRKRIMQHYLLTWFVPDLCTCIPFDVILSASVDGSDPNLNQNLRMVRMVRVLKLVRIVRATRILKRWQDSVAISYAVATLIRFVLITLVLAHWLACFWGILGAPHQPSPDDLSTLSHAPDGGPNWSGKYGDGLTWIQKYRLETLTAFELYGIALYVALNNIFGGASEVNPANPSEFYAQCAMLLLGSSVWAYIIGSACGIIATLDPASIEYRQTIDELNFFCDDQQMPKELRVELRSYFRNTLYNVRLKRYETLLAKMSQKLRGDAAFHMCEYRLSHVPFLVHKQLEVEFMSNLAIRMTPTVYSHLERVPCTRLLIVGRGVVAKRGRLSVSGASLGQDVILSNDNLRDLGDAIALTFVQASCISQKDIFGLLPDYPLAYRIVRRAAMRLALVRALSKAARIARMKKEGGTASSVLASLMYSDGMSVAAGAAATGLGGGGNGGDGVGAAEMSVEDAITLAVQEPLYPSVEPPPAHKLFPVFPSRAEAESPQDGDDGAPPEPAPKGQAKGKRSGNPHLSRQASGGRRLWGTYSRVVKPPTTDDRIDELRDELRQTNSELLERIGQMERLLRSSLTGEGSFTNKSSAPPLPRRMFGSLFGGSGNREAFEA